MTIGIGILAYDGIVLAADSQVTTEITSQHGKVTALWSRDVDPRPDGTAIISHQGGLAICVAGWPVGYAFRAAELLSETFNADLSVSGNSLRIAFEETLQHFIQRDIVPYVGGANLAQQPPFQLLIASSRDGHQHLWATQELATLRSVDPYHAIGSGEVQATPMIGNFYRNWPRLDLASTVVLAAFVVHQVKKTNLYCGNTTDISCVRNGAMLHVFRRFTTILDRLFDENEEILMRFGLVTALDALTDAEEQQMRTLRQALSEVAQSIRRECFFEKEIKGTPDAEAQNPEPLPPAPTTPTIVSR